MKTPRQHLERGYQLTSLPVSFITRCTLACTLKTPTHQENLVLQGRPSRNCQWGSNLRYWTPEQLRPNTISTLTLVPAKG